MAKVVLTSGLARFTDGETEFDIEAGDVRYLFRALTEMYPALGPHLEQGIAVAIDGVIYSDAWLESLKSDSEVYILPQVGGGKSAA